ncbi:uncharacterized protein IWZ02DRAFT_57267 [Phyllosticta citriasiana]|uniref:uncharacterized protein n=1 Tax=Phyllosticta citriasiana TaxID=595635 RepID=UPI0030FD3412
MSQPPGPRVRSLARCGAARGDRCGEGVDPLPVVHKYTYIRTVGMGGGGLKLNRSNLYSGFKRKEPRDIQNGKGCPDQRALRVGRQMFGERQKRAEEMSRGAVWRRSVDWMARLGVTCEAWLLDLWCWWARVGVSTYSLVSDFEFFFFFVGFFVWQLWFQKSFEKAGGKCGFVGWDWWLKLRSWVRDRTVGHCATAWCLYVSSARIVQALEVDILVGFVASVVVFCFKNL